MPTAIHITALNRVLENATLFDTLTEPDLAFGVSVGFVVDFDARNTILRVTFEGHLTDEVAFDCSKALNGLAASYPPCNGIVDLSNVTQYDVSPYGIRRLATMPQPPSSPVRMLVIVAPKDHAYGMSRMFQIHTESTRPNQRVVRSMEEAFELLGVDSAEFIPLARSKTG